MEEIEKFIDYINQKTCNKFEFLRLKQVFFDVEKNKLSIDFLYPSTQILTQDNKAEITSFIRQFVNLDLHYNINFTKSYLEPALVLNCIKKYLEKNNKLLYSAIRDRDVVIDCQNEKITFNLEEQYYNYFLSSNISKTLFSHLYRNFCANFEISATNVGVKEVDQSVLKNRLSELTTKSELDALLSANKDRFVVEDRRLMIGKEIVYNPRRIKSINRCIEDCILAGEICFLTEKSFTSKRTKKNEFGIDEQIIKPFFNFQLKDDSGSIYAVYFPTKASYHKMHLLKNGDNIVLQGKISQYNGNYEINVKSISLCSIPKANAIEVVANQDLISEYRFVNPKPFTLRRQANLFEENHYSNEVLNGSYVVYDFETTGIDPINDEIIEIGALKIVNGEFREVFTTLVKPTKPIPAEATKVNKITNDMVKNCYSISQVLPDFYLFCKGCQMVGYNSVAFDYLFLDKVSKAVNIKFDNGQLDVFLMAKQKLKGLSNYKLSSVAKYLEVPLIDAHRALNDVIATAEVFMRLY